MIVSIHQPNFLPWLGFFHKMAKSDVFILLDVVQYSKNSFQNRTQIKTAQNSNWLTVPVLTSSHFKQKTNEVRIDNSNDWRKKHLHTIKVNYGRSNYFKRYFPLFEEVYRKEWSKLADLNSALINTISNEFNIKSQIKQASLIEVTSKGTDLLLNICQSLGADSYLSGPSGRQYLEEEKFKNSGIEIIYNNFSSPKYQQQFRGFIPNLSAIDFLFNCGAEAFSEVL